jgi:hypothetical protein
MSAAVHHLPTSDRATAPPSLAARGARGTATAVELTSQLARPAAVRSGTTVPRASEDGSLVTEYGLLAVVAATIAGVVISWASNGALVTLFNALLRHARGLVGA